MTKDSISAFTRRIRESIALAQPVMIVRENTIVPPDTGDYYPLDIVLLDGYSSGGDTFHMSFPMGSDRGLRKGGDYPLETAFEYVTEAKLIFSAPVEQKVAFPKSVK